MLTSEQIERVENVLACNKEWHPASTVCVRKDDLTALLQLARAVQDAARIEVSREDWIDHCDAFGADLIGQTVALVPVPVKEG